MSVVAVKVAKQTRMTTAEFLRLHVHDSGIELHDGIVVRLPMPGSDHGEVCATATAILHTHIKKKKLGRVVCNDTFVRVSEEAGKVYGADIAYISYKYLPKKEPTPIGALIPPFELVIEVKSPYNTHRELGTKAMAYLEAGVKVAVVLDPKTQSAAVFRENEFPQRFHNGDEFTLPDVFPGFSVPVSRFFE